VPDPASTATQAAIWGQPPPGSPASAATPALPRTARVRQLHSRIAASRRFPGGPPPTVTGIRNVSALARIWATTPTPGTGISSRSSITQASCRPAASATVPIGERGDQPGVTGQQRQAAAVRGGLARISGPQAPARDGTRQAGGHPGSGQPPRPAEIRAGEQRGHHDREPAGGQLEHAAGGAGACWLIRVRSTIGHSMAWSR
jgi:hypothetical protein